MKFVDMFKTVFPKPVMPQKRYLLLAVALVYGGLKLYTHLTPSLNDDKWPEDFRNAVMYVVDLDQDNPDIQTALANLQRK